MCIKSNCLCMSEVSILCLHAYVSTKYRLSKEQSLKLSLKLAETTNLLHFNFTMTFSIYTMSDS